MRLARCPVLMAMVLAMSSPAVAGSLEDSQRHNPGLADSPFAAAGADDNAELDRIRKIMSPHIEGDTLVVEGEIDSHIDD